MGGQRLPYKTIGLGRPCGRKSGTATAGGPYHSSSSDDHGGSSLPFCKPMRRSHRLWKLLAPFYLKGIQTFGPDVHHGGPPSGTFRELDCITKGEVTGSLVARKRTLPPIPEHSEIRLAGLDQEKHQDWPLLWTSRQDTFMAAPSLAHIDNDGRACLESMFGPHAWTDPAWHRRHSRPLRVLAGNHTSIVSRWTIGHNYFHWFMDGLTRLRHLEFFPDDTRILVPGALPEFAIRSLELLNLKERTIAVDTGEDLRIEKYWFAGPTMLSGCPDIEGVTWLRERFLRNAGTSPASLIYLDRQSGRRSCHNAEELRRWFERRGWRIVDPGRLSLDEQILTFANARAVAGIHGAGLTNLLWMPAGGKVLEIMPSRRRNGCYAGISLCAGLDHRAWVLPSDRLGNLSVPLDAMADQVSWVEE